MTPNNLKLNPNPPVEWRVKWEIDILADTAEDAARQARDIQRDPRSIASVFLVAGEGLGVWHEIDLGPLESPEPTQVVEPANTQQLGAHHGQVLNDLRHAGWAVVLFTPDELRGVEPDRLQDRLVELGNEVIDNLSDEPADLDEPDAPSPLIDTRPAPPLIPADADPVKHPHHSAAEGWGLFDEDGTYKIQRIDDPHEGWLRFKTDDEALGFVFQRSVSGSPYHAAAFQLHATPVPGVPQAPTAPVGELRPAYDPVIRIPMPR